MNVNPLCSIAAQLSRLSVGLSRTSMRLKSSKKKRKPIPPNFGPGHGEKIWIFSNYQNGLTVYSHDPIIKANRALKQIPFNGKKLKPAKIRKDYWRPLAMIQFPEGMGHVGRSVFHVLRELRMAHELKWGNEGFINEETGATLTRRQRGEKLNDQKANSIADMAAALSGVGKGNKVWMSVTDGGVNVEKSADGQVDEDTGHVTGLVKATVFWNDSSDMRHVEEWPSNISHALFANSGVQVLEGSETVAALEEEAEHSQTVPPELVAGVQAQREESQLRQR